MNLCKKISLLSSVCFSISAFAGPGWYVTIENNSNESVTATGVGGGGNHCWYSDDLDGDGKTVAPNSTLTFYTEEDDSGGCFFNSSPRYQRFLLKANNQQVQYSLFSDHRSNNYSYVRNEVSGLTSQGSNIVGQSGGTAYATVDIESGGLLNSAPIDLHN